MAQSRKQRPQQDCASPRTSESVRPPSSQGPQGSQGNAFVQEQMTSTKEEAPAGLDEQTARDNAEEKVEQVEQTGEPEFQQDLEVEEEGQQEGEMEAPDEEEAQQGQAESEGAVTDGAELGGGDDGGDEAEAPAEPEDDAGGAPEEPVGAGGSAGPPADEGGSADSADEGSGGGGASVGTATAKMSATSNRASSLVGRSVQFQASEYESGPDPVVSEAATSQRMSSERLAGGFVRQNAANVQGFMAQAEALPERIMAATQTAIDTVDSALEETRARIQSAAGAARTDVSSQAAETHAHIDSEHGAALSTIEGTVAGAQAEVDSAQAGSDAAISGLEAEGAAAVTSTHARWDEPMRQAGVLAGEEAIREGESLATGWEGQKNGESTLLSGPVHDNRLEARADVARKVASSYQQGLTEEADKQAGQIMQGEPEVQEVLRTQMQAGHEILVEQHEAATGMLEDTRVQGVQTAGAAQTEMHQSVSDVEQQGLQSIEQQEQRRLSEAEQHGGNLREGLSSAGSEAAMALAEESSVAGTIMLDQLDQMSTQMGGQQSPNPEELADVLGGAQGEFDGVVAQTAGQLETAADRAQGMIENAGGQGVSALSAFGDQSTDLFDQTRSSLAEGAQTMREGASESYQRLTDQHGEFVGQAKEAAAGSFTSVEEGLAGHVQSMNQTLDQNFEEGRSGLATGLSESKRQQLRDTHEKANEAAAAVQPRWKSVLKWVLIISVIILVCVVAGPLGALVGQGLAAAAGALGLTVAAGSGLAMAMTVVGGAITGAILGGAAGAAIQAGTNHIYDRPLGEGLKEAIWAGVIGGALGGAAGAWMQGAHFLKAAAVEFGADMFAGLATDLFLGNELNPMNWLMGAGIGLGVGSGLRLHAARSAANPVPTGALDGGAPGVRPVVDAPSTRVQPEAPSTRVQPEAPSTRVQPEAPTPKVQAEAPKVEADAPAPRVEAEAPKVEAEAPRPRKVEESQGGMSKAAKKRAKLEERTGAARQRVKERFGDEGAEAFETLVGKNVDPGTAESILKRTKDLELESEIYTLLRSGKLDQGSYSRLNKLLGSAQADVYKIIDSDFTGRFPEMEDVLAVAGPRNEIVGAAGRVGDDAVDAVSLGGRANEGGGRPAGEADVVVYNKGGDGEAIQMKAVQGDKAGNVADNINGANRQLGGQNQSGNVEGKIEVPPEGFQRVADIRVPKNNELYGRSRAEVLDALQDQIHNADNLNSRIVAQDDSWSRNAGKPGEVRIDVGHPDGPYRFTAEELGGMKSSQAEAPGTRVHPEMPGKVDPTNKVPTQAKHHPNSEVTAGQRALAPGTEITLPPRSWLEKMGLKKAKGRVIRVDGDRVEVDVGGGKIETFSRPEMLRRLKVDSQQVADQPGLDENHATDQTTYKDFGGPAFGPDAPTPKAVNQGSLGDCWFMAAMGATARQKPGALRRLIQDNGNGTYDVTLYLRNNAGELVPSVKTVDMRMPTSNQSSPLYAKDGGQGEWWGPILEKRLAMETGSYEAIRGSNINKHVDFRGGTELLTGNNTRYIRTGSMDDQTMLRYLKQSMDDGRPITAGARAESKTDTAFNQAAKQEGVVLNHAYSLKDVDVDAGTLTLDNPWGPTTKDLVIDIDKYQQYFSGADVEAP